MTERYTNNYRILGIQPGASWQELRQAYKSLVNIWHPDRFQQNVRQRKLAEEKTKEITQSYQELAEYYKKYGALPRRIDTTETYITPDIDPLDSMDVHPAPDKQDTDPLAASVTPAGVPLSRRSKLRSRTMIAAAMAFAAYFFWQVVPWDNSSEAPQDENRTEQAADTQKDDNSPDHAPHVDKFFTVGTPLGEVYAIQGIPTKTEHDVWYYGNSRVYFRNGKVQHWEESSDSPLRVKIDPEIDKTGAKFFSKGSTKKEVLALQGAPDRDSGNVWDYGVSRVYFDNNRVTGWDESPLNPLKLQR